MDFWIKKSTNPLFFFFLSKEKGSKNHLEDKYVASGIKDLEQLGLNKRKKLDRMDNWLCP